MKLKIATVFILLLATASLHAQQEGKTQFNISYNAALPVGSFKAQLSEKSLRGFRAGVMHGINDNFSIGFGTGYQDFYQKFPRSMFKMEDGSDLSAVRSYSIQTIPLMVQGKYQIAPGKAIQPYLALGAGGSIINYLDLLGEFVHEERVKFGFTVKPEAGIHIPFGKTKESAFNLGASYSILPVKIGAFSNMNHIGIHAGLSFPMRK